MKLRSLCGLCVILAFASTGSAQDVKSPLRFVPSQAEWVVKVDRPGDLLKAVETNELFLDAKKLAGVREYYDSTNFQQLYQLLAYFEKQLDRNRDEIVADLTAGGIVIGVKLTPPGGAVLVMQSRDEKSLRRFLDVALDVLQKELERQESKDKIVRSKYKGHDVGQIGGKLSFAVTGGALVVGSDEKALKSALDSQGKTSIAQAPGFAAAYKQAPAKALAWTWLNLEAVRKNNPDFNNGLESISKDPLQMLLLGGLGDLLKRAPSVTAVLTPDGPAGYRVAVAMPVGRDRMAPIKHMILPPAGAGTLPTLNPPRTISSSSYYLDLGQLWDKRVAILGEKNAAGLDDGNKNLGKFLGGIKIEKLFKAMGPHHRLVFAQQKERPYKIKAAAPFPAFALVVDMRDPSFATDMNAIFRSAALFATFQYGLSLKEEKHNDCTMISYYFSETKKVEGDPVNTRFNFSPTYVTVGNQFVMSATAELARDLIDAIKAEEKQEPGAASMRTQLHAAGLAEIVRRNEELTLTQFILAQALPPKTARAEIQAIINWLDRLGTVGLESHYNAGDFRYDILWQPKR